MIDTRITEADDGGRHRRNDLVDREPAAASNTNRLEINADRQSLLASK